MHWDPSELDTPSFHCGMGCENLSCCESCTVDEDLVSLPMEEIDALLPHFLLSPYTTTGTSLNNPAYYDLHQSIRIAQHPNRAAVLIAKNWLCESQPTLVENFFSHRDNALNTEATTATWNIPSIQFVHVCRLSSANLLRVARQRCLQFLTAQRRLVQSNNDDDDKYFEGLSATDI